MQKEESHVLSEGRGERGQWSSLRQFWLLAPESLGNGTEPSSPCSCRGTRGHLGEQPDPRCFPSSPGAAEPPWPTVAPRRGMTPALPKLLAAAGPSLGSTAEEGCSAGTPHCSAGAQGEAQHHTPQGGGPGPTAPTGSPMARVTLPHDSPCHTTGDTFTWAQGGSAEAPAPWHPACSPCLPPPPSLANEPSPLHRTKAMSWFD